MIIIIIMIILIMMPNNNNNNSSNNYNIVLIYSLLNWFCNEMVKLHQWLTFNRSEITYTFSKKY